MFMGGGAPPEPTPAPQAPAPVPTAAPTASGGYGGQRAPGSMGQFGGYGGGGGGAGGGGTYGGAGSGGYGGGGHPAAASMTDEDADFARVRQLRHRFWIILPHFLSFLSTTQAPHVRVYYVPVLIGC